MRRNVLTLLAPLLAAAACAGQSVASSDPAHDRMPRNATVVRVVDGDTIRVTLGGREEPVRLIGIDTPETRDPRKPVQCFGREAAARTAALLPRGTPVHLERDVEARDRYRRVLAYVFRARDGLFVNLALARDGFAQPLTIPPNVTHADAFAAAAREARESGLGLWGACDGG